MQATPMMAQYIEIKERHKDELLFYRMGDFYELFFDDAVKASETLDIALTKRGQHEGQDIPMCGVPAHSHESYLLKLIRAGHRVAIAEQLEDPGEAKKREYKAVVRRDVVRIVTPGTITEDSLLESTENSFLLALTVKKNQAGVAWADLSGRILNTQSIQLAQVEALLTQLNPREILLADRTVQTPELFDAFRRLKHTMTVLPLQKFSEQIADEALMRCYQVHTTDVFQKMEPLEKQSLGALVDYLSLTQKTTMNLPFPRSIKSTYFMDIDASTRFNLELTRTQKGLKKGSLLDALDMTMTSAGARLFERTLSAPLTAVPQIHKRLDAVGYLKEQQVLRQALRICLKGIPDLERALTRITLDRLKPRDLESVKTALFGIEKLKAYLQGHNFPTLLEHAATTLGNFDLLSQELQAALNEELPAQFSDGGLVKQGYSPELDELRSLKEKGADHIEDLRQKYVSETKINTLKIKHNNILGYFIEVTAQHADKLMQLFIHKQTLANNIRFTSPELSEIEQRINSAESQAQALEMSIIGQCVDAIKADAEALFMAAESLAQMDVLSSLAELAHTRNYTRPLVDETKAFEVREGRHPLVEEALRSHSEKPFVPNDCVLNEARVWLITGPNMGGKSTFLRQNALIVIMAQMGGFVPASYAHIGIVDRLCSRIGAADDLARNQSTFMVEMVETASILHHATSKSLVILDEIGRGTATYDGLAIAWGVLEYIHNKNQCRTLFATHYHELTDLSQSLTALGLYTTQVQEWENQLIFMHKVVEGTADKSYGIHVARLAGIPEEVINRAEHILQGFETDKEEFRKIA